jgi:sphinganine-1-phosphate aldolase
MGENMSGGILHSQGSQKPTQFEYRLVVIQLNPNTCKLEAAAVKPYLSRNTAVVVASAYTFPHGILDDVEGISALCASRNISLHVDACMGGFVLPFMRDLGYALPKFDFSAEGVTSMSVDTHKYGQAHKGTSVVLYRTRERRHAQYTAVTEWSGGLYVSPGLAGSRCVAPRRALHCQKHACNDFGLQCSFLFLSSKDHRCRKEQVEVDPISLPCV